jgi:hypothetical protein
VNAHEPVVDAERRGASGRVASEALGDVFELRERRAVLE